MTIPQESSRVTIQATIITNLLSLTNKISVSLNNAIVVEGFFVNQINFPSEIEMQYQQSMELSDSYDKSYEITQVQYQKKMLQIQSTKATIALLKEAYRFSAQVAFNNKFESVIRTDLTNEQLS